MPIITKTFKWIIRVVFGLSVAYAAGTTTTNLSQMTPLPISQDVVAQKMMDDPAFAQKYTVDGSSFVDVVNNSPTENLQVRIGDETADTFTPSLELRKWDGQARLRVVPQLETQTPDTAKSLSFASKTADFSNGDDESVQFYDVSDSTTTPEGGYEMQWSMDSEPATNTFNFALEMDGIDCYYQPPLTDQEIKDGAFRPDNVIGSYACYYKESGDYSQMSGMNYRTGKAFHIYRPKATDADGNWMWGTLDLKDNVLTVTVPQDFLDKATYPVKVDPTFGYTTQGASDQQAGTTNGSANPTGLLSTLTEPGNISKITAYTQVTVLAKNTTSKIYFGSAGSRDVLISTTNNTSVGLSFAWNNFAFAFNYSMAATTYWIQWSGYGGDGPSTSIGHIMYDTGGDANTSYNVNDAGIPVYGTQKFSIYATYSLPPNPSGYGQYRAITINHNYVASSSTTTIINFPVLISTTSFPSLATVTNGGKVTSDSGYDIIFSLASSSPSSNGLLYYERESYSSTTGASNFWVNVPKLSTSTDTTIYMFYGNSGVTTDQSNASGTWNTNYKGVWHLANSATTASSTDSTSNALNGTNIATVATTTGQIDGAAQLNGSSAYINVARTTTLEPTLITLSAWVYLNATGTNQVIIQKDHGAAGWAYILGDNQPVANKITFETGTANASTSDALYGKTWVYMVGKYDGTYNYLYMNGTQVDKVAAAAMTNGNYPTTFGAYATGPNYFTNGRIDEVRISDVSRSADWIKTEYNNQFSPSTFYSVGTETSLGGAASPPPAGTVRLQGNAIFQGNVIIK